MRISFLASLLLLGVPFVAQASKLHETSVRASEINPLAKEHPELNFTFAEVKGKHQDLQHAIVDTRVPSLDRLVIWLMNMGMLNWCMLSNTPSACRLWAAEMTCWSWQAASTKSPLVELQQNQ